MASKKDGDDELFNRLKKQLLMMDPVSFCEEYLTMDGKPFKLSGNGYKPFCDIYRYIGIKALEPTAKPVIIVKGRQVGGTTMATALEMYFMGSGMFGNGDKPPARVMHLFPQLELAAAYSKTKLNSMISSSVPSEEIVTKGGKPKSYMQSLLDKSSAVNDSLQFKQFLGGNHLWIESTGLDADRIMGRQLSLDTELPTPNGFIKLRDLKEGDKLFDEKGNVCNVTKMHPINISPESYKITFDNGQTVDACSEHLWLTSVKNKSSVKNTKQILNTINEKHIIKSKLSKDAKNLIFSIGMAELSNYKNKSIIIKIELIESIPMRCITVDSPSHLFLITRSFIPTHNTADIMFFDETQKISTAAMGNALKILTTSKYGEPSKGVRIMFGTPRRKGSDYHKNWQSSTQQYYHLGCEKCEKHFPLYTPGSDEWEKIWLYGYIVKCTHCGFEQNKLEAAERGKWIALKNADDPDCKMIGFHINQLYMPMFTKEAILAEKPGIHPINTERVYQNEVLGEFFQGDTSPISPDEIREHCADFERKFRGKINPGEEEFVIMGIDYGARADAEQLANPDKASKAGQSYSTAVILASKGPGLLSIEFCTKFKRNDPESKKGIIDQLMRNYSVDLAVGDIGFSNDFSQTLQNIYGNKYLVSRALGKLNGHVKFSEDIFPKEIGFERDFYVGELFEQMKKGQIRFPYGDYEKTAWLVEHCASMEIKPSISRTGDATIHYVKGGTPNDGFMALLNAYLAYKFLISNGFKSNNPFGNNNGGGGKQKQIPAITGLIRRRM